MALEAYRVVAPFGWNGWNFAPATPCVCVCDDSADSGAEKCAKKPGASCPCKRGGGCHCVCTINRDTFAGDIWLVEEGHPRKGAMLGQLGGVRLAIYDAALPAVDDLAKQPQYKRLLRPPKVLVPA